MPAQASPPELGGKLTALPCGTGRAFESGMASSGKTGTSGKADARAARKARLAAALRENLKRRKQQARERAVAPKSPQDSAAGAGPDFRRNQGGE